MPSFLVTTRLFGISLLLDQLICSVHAELAIRFGVMLRKVWGGNRKWVGDLTSSRPLR